MYFKIMNLLLLVCATFCLFVVNEVHAQNKVDLKLDGSDGKDKGSIMYMYTRYINYVQDVCLFVLFFVCCFFSGPHGSWSVHV